MNILASVQVGADDQILSCACGAPMGAHSRLMAVFAAINDGLGRLAERADVSKICQLVGEFLSAATGEANDHSVLSL